MKKAEAEEKPLLPLLELQFHCPHCRMPKRQIKLMHDDEHEPVIHPIMSANPKEEFPNWTPDIIGIFPCPSCGRSFLITMPEWLKLLLAQQPLKK